MTNLDLRLECPPADAGTAAPSAGTPPPASVPPVSRAKSKPLRCKKGFRKKRVHGKVRCLKVKRKHRPRR